MPKRPIRQKLLQQRRMLDETECVHLSHRVQQGLLGTDVYRSASSVALYAPIHNEVLTGELFASAIRDGKRVCYPRVDQGSLQFLTAASENDLAPGSFGVAEPTGSMVVPVAELDLVVVPGVAFDRDGYRLGYGQGYYDRAISSANSAVLVGLAYEFQIIDKLPVEEHDVCLDMLVADSGILAFENRH